MKKITKIFSSILLALPMIAGSCGEDKKLYGPAPTEACEKGSDCQQTKADQNKSDRNSDANTDYNEYPRTLYGPDGYCRDQDPNYCTDVYASGWNKSGQWYCADNGECAKSDSSSDAGTDNN